MYFLLYFSFPLYSWFENTEIPSQYGNNCVCSYPKVLSVKFTQFRRHFYIPPAYIAITDLYLLVATIKCDFVNSIVYVIKKLLVTLCFCFVGTFTGMRTIVIVDFVGIDYLSHAYGWVSFFQGISCIPVPPLAGKIISTYNRTIWFHSQPIFNDMV